MQLKCTNCQRIITISEDKLPRDKEKAMVKCPTCQQVLVFKIPAVQKQQLANADKTIIEQVRPKALRPRLCHAVDNTEYPLEKGKNILGRDADISIAGDRYISRKHCTIEVVEQHGDILCILTDDGSLNTTGEPSTNGTFHNDRRLTRFDKLFLSNGDKVRIGRTDFLFKTE